jgi:hypothetical protein
MEKLQELNPGFDGKETHAIENGAVTKLSFATNNVVDISPVRALAGLKELMCPGEGHRGAGRLSDLSPLQGMSLTHFSCWATQVSDLTPLRGTSLDNLNRSQTEVSDLSPLAGMPLWELAINDTKVTDLSPLKNTSVARLLCTFVLERDAEILRSITSLETINGKPAAEYWRELDWARVAPPANVPPPGFEALFNGRDLTGWQGAVPITLRGKLSEQELAAKQAEANAKVLPHWTVKDGVLFYDGQGQNLQTVRDYRNFELLIDWKISAGGDSGIYLRGVPQVQICDKPAGSGGLYNNRRGPKEPLSPADERAGLWNRFRIQIVGDRVTVHLNGALVVDGVTMENYWDRSQPLPAAGPIELQHFAGPLEFQNIFIKELP